MKLKCTVLMIFIFSMGLIDSVFCREDFPFSSYQMLSHPYSNYKHFSLYAIDENKQKHLYFLVGPLDPDTLYKIMDNSHLPFKQNPGLLLRILLRFYKFFDDDSPHRLKALQLFEVVDQKEIPIASEKTPYDDE